MSLFVDERLRELRSKVSLRLGRVITMAAPNRNYEFLIKKIYLLIFHLLGLII